MVAPEVLLSRQSGVGCSDQVMQDAGWSPASTCLARRTEMFRTILVPLDGSPLAERALPFAEALARATGGSIVLVRAAWARVIADADWIEAQAEAMDEAKSYLERVADHLAKRGIPTQTAVSSGYAAGVIVDETRLRKADVVVMATHGRSGLGRWVYGSVAEAVLARSQVPVLLIRAWQDEHAVDAIPDHPRLLVPLDGSEFAEAALPVAESLADALGGTLLLLRVVRLPEAPLTEDGKVIAYVDQELERLRAEAQDYLARVARGLAVGHSAVESAVRVGEPSDAIVAASREFNASLVIMATHGRTGLSRLLLGSVADGVLRRGRVPVMLVRPTPAPLAAYGPAIEEREPVVLGGTVSLTFSPEELGLLQVGLRLLLNSSQREEHVFGRVHQLLGRLEEAGKRAAGARLPVAR